MKQYKIIWSPLAEETYLRTIRSILAKWTIREANNFADKVDNLIELLKTQKYLCPVSGKKTDLRRCVITPQTSMVYQVKEDVVEIVAFFDNRSEHGY